MLFFVSNIIFNDNDSNYGITIIIWLVYVADIMHALIV